ncbi:MAG: hypothetical protein AAFZ15_34680, partial [Bacteroidota bacterium]
ENVQKFKNFFANNQDLDLLRQIKNEQIETQSFDFDGVKYKTKQIDEVLAMLEEELDVQHKELIELEGQAFCHHYLLAEKKGIKKLFLDNHIAYTIIASENNKYGESYATTQYYFSVLQNNPQLSGAQAEYLLGEMKNVRTNVFNHFKASEKIDLPAEFGSIPEGTKWSEFLIPDIPFYKRDIKDGDSFLHFYKGISDVYFKINETMLTAYSKLIWFQSDLLEK